MRAGTLIAPRAERTRTVSPSLTPSARASASLSCAHASGAAASSSGARPVFVRVWNW